MKYQAQEDEEHKEDEHCDCGDCDCDDCEKRELRHMTPATLNQIGALAKRIATLTEQAQEAGENREMVENLIHDAFGELEDIITQE
jgi:hypothetical protein